MSDAAEATSAIGYRDALISSIGRTAIEVPVPAEFASPPRLTSSPVRFEFLDTEIAGLGRLRFTGIEGGPTMIFSLMLFPYDIERVPVFASEFVLFGKLVRAAVIDLQPLTPAAATAPEFQRGMQQLAAESPGLLADGPLPEWCRAHFTPQAIFVLRKSPDALLEKLDRAFTRYAEFYASLTAPIASTPPAADPEALRDYKHHHIENTPGLAYLCRSFGDAWTRRFLHEAMYR